MDSIDFGFYSWDIVEHYLLNGLYFTLLLTLVSTIGGIMLGTVLALMRLSSNKLLYTPAKIYINAMRSIPLVMVILWFYLLCLRAFILRWALVHTAKSFRQRLRLLLFRRRILLKLCARASSLFRAGKCMLGRRWA